ncbi:MAG: phage holin family protein, partial [Acidobacteriota bacterium]
MSRQWSETFRALGNAVLSLLKAELEAFERDVTRSTRQAALAIGLFAAAGAFAFWTLGVATYFLIQLVALWLPLWGASLAVTGLFALVVAVLAWIGMRKLE